MRGGGLEVGGLGRGREVSARGVACERGTIALFLGSPQSSLGTRLGRVGLVVGVANLTPRLSTYHTTNVPMPY